jgi:hypothetical protein
VYLWQADTMLHVSVEHEYRTTNSSRTYCAREGCTVRQLWRLPIKMAGLRFDGLHGVQLCAFREPINA